MPASTVPVVQGDASSTTGKVTQIAGKVTTQTAIHAQDTNLSSVASLNVTQSPEGTCWF